jgi:hypothetical protein
VGAHDDGQGDYYDLIERWDGNSWAVQDLGTGGELYSVSCPISDMCAAVGDDPQNPMEMLWDGSTWSSSSEPAYTTDGSIFSVSCVSPTRCTVVGEADWGGVSGIPASQSALTGFLRPGSQWHVYAQGLAWSLHGVSCAGSNDCTAVNFKAVHWNGRKWTIQAKFNAQMHGVSCVATSCMAVGQDPSTKLPAAAQYVK